jgi:DNA-binding transcriptional MerR regulator
MITISTLAKRSGLSRTALLYYDRLGLLKPFRRNRSGYRLYSSSEANRLEQICLYRKMGIPLREMKKLLDVPGNNVLVEILQRRLHVLDHEISDLRKQQRSIWALLKQKPLQQGEQMIGKERWIEIMHAAGFKDQDMHNWHIQFERMEPEAHQEFLESLCIPKDEVTKIREWSRERGA